jgi:RimJ/RimL family protein N-acetyltransferase
MEQERFSGLYNHSVMNLSSHRLIYRKITSADLPVYLNMAMNEDVMKYITGKALTFKEAQERLKTMTDTNDEAPELGFHMVYEKEGNNFIGLGKLVFVKDDTAELGYSLLPQHWGKKYASEIAGFFINHARSISYIHELIALVNPENSASKKLLAKYGFTWFETGFLNEQPTEIHKLNLQKS